MNELVYIEGQRLDLFDDETVTIEQSVKNVQRDLDKIYSDFSKSFTVPASDNNNQIFSHWYNSFIDNGYDARLRKFATIDVNTLNFKRGKVRLDDVKIENGKPVHYRITFFGNVIKIKDLLGDDKLSQLDWLDNFNHSYSGDQVKTGLTTGLNFTVNSVTYNKAVIYPLISYKRQWFYNSNGDTTDTDTLVNIANNGSVGIESTNLKPAIQLWLIIKAIQEKYDLNFTGTFFETELFQQLYMNLNADTDTLETGILEYENESGTVPNTTVTTTRLRYSTTVTPDDDSIPYRIKLTINDEVVYESTSFLQGTQTKQGIFEPIQEGDDYTVKAEVITATTFIFDATTTLEYQDLTAVAPITLSWETVSGFPNSYVNQAIALTTAIRTEVPDLEVYDFLTGIFKMFNLTAVADGDDISVEDLPNWYAQGQIYDITQYVDTATETIKRGNILREIDFKFQESESILADQFLQSNKQSYGDLEFKLTDANGNPLQDVDGDTLDIEVPFENPINERLFDLNDNSETTIQYCLYTDRDINAISGDPFIFYAPSVSIINNPIGYVNDGVYEQITGTVFMPSHSMQIDTESFNVNFNAEINEYTSSIFQDTIYKRFYEDYINDIFSIKRRIYTYKAILPPQLLNNLKLNDRLIIKDRRYIINNISSTLTPDREDTLELINDIYEAPLVTDTLNTNMFRQDTQFYNSSETKDSVTWVGSSNPVTVKFANLGGVSSFITLDDTLTDSNVFEVKFTVDENTTGVDRACYIYMNDDQFGDRFYIYQYAKEVGSLNFSNEKNTVLYNIITGKS